MMNEQFEEGTRSLDRKQRKQNTEPAVDADEKEKIDKKKLIVYATIMNPKFDE